ncbi:MAG TPA: NAD(+) synthase [Propionibacteriaceae bacterium]|nr:NAD(+) synthase [Propionibacteriaceae bacterium]
MSTALSPAGFELDAPAVAQEIERFIASQMAELGRTGIVVPLSGGLDSSTVLALCVRAVGADRVTALLLRDKRGSRDALRFSRLVAGRLGVRVVVQDATRVNRAAGVYEFAGYRLPLPRFVARVVRRYLARGENIFLAGIRGTDHRLTREALAAIYARQRLRLVMTYRYADLHRLAVVGTAHKSEDLLGLFVKFGVDDAADLMPLKGLYRSHVLQLARVVGVPDEVLERTPNPEMLPGIEDKYVDVFGVPAPTVDLVLWGIEHGLSDEEIAEDVPLTGAKVVELREAVRLSAHMREPSRHPDLGRFLAS